MARRQGVFAPTAWRGAALDCAPPTSRISPQRYSRGNVQKQAAPGNVPTVSQLYDVGEGDNVLVLVHGHPFNRTMAAADGASLSCSSSCSIRGVSSSESSVETTSGREGDSIVVVPKILDHEDDAGFPWKAIVPDLRGYSRVSTNQSNG